MLALSAAQIIQQLLQDFPHSRHSLTQKEGKDVPWSHCIAFTLLPACSAPSEHEYVTPRATDSKSQYWRLFSVEVGPVPRDRHFGRQGQLGSRARATVPGYLDFLSEEG